MGSFDLAFKVLRELGRFESWVDIITQASDTSY